MGATLAFKYLALACAWPWICISPQVHLVVLVLYSTQLPPQTCPTAFVHRWWDGGFVEKPALVFVLHSILGRTASSFYALTFSSFAVSF